MVHPYNDAGKPHEGHENRKVYHRMRAHDDKNCGAPPILPVFTDHEHGDPPTNRSTVTREARAPCKKIKLFIHCGICNDLVMEATTSECGHVFCRQCIDSALLRCCPTCGKNFGNRIYVASIDDHIKCHLPALGEGINKRWSEAQAQRKIREMNEKLRWTYPIKVCQKRVDGYMTRLEYIGVGAMKSTYSFCTRQASKIWVHRANIIFLIIGITVGSSVMLLGLTRNVFEFTTLSEETISKINDEKIQGTIEQPAAAYPVEEGNTHDYDCDKNIFKSFLNLFGFQV